ncbi:MAG: alpha/beta hydrolase-fold protein [Pseudomonadota bacterium]|nr:alpha/beta hydrolase-fold protein [Pseudomonadota bacterium]
MKTPFSPPSGPGAHTSPVCLPDSHRIDLHDARGITRRLFVAVPPHPAPPDGYPVLFTLDGNALFSLFAGLMWQHAAHPDASAAAATPIIVGIGYPMTTAYDQAARERDYTMALGPSPGSPTVSGADNLLDFVQQIARPWLARQWSLDEQRQGLFGHSYGGLLTLYALFTRPRLFQHYTAASPSIWWGDRAIMPHARHFLDHGAQGSLTGTQASLLITVGGLEESSLPPSTERQRRQSQRRMVSQARDLSTRLQAAAGLHSRFELLDGEDHGSVVPRSAALALRQLAGEAASRSRP